MLRRMLLSMSRSDQVRHLVETAPVSRGVVARFVAGETAEEAVARHRRAGRRAAGWSTPRPPRRGHGRARAGRRDPRRLPAAAEAARRRRADRRRRGLGQALRGRPGAARRRRAIALDNARAICEAAQARRHDGHPRHGGPHHDRLDAGHPARAARATSPTPARCCRPTCAAPRPTAATWPTRAPASGCARAPTRSRSRSPTRTSGDVDRSYVRCLKVLHGRRGLPDGRHPRPAAGRDRRDLAAPQRPRAGHATSTRCSTASGRTSSGGWPPSGEKMRVYVPYGDEWYGYLVRRLAERPANLAFFLRVARDQGLTMDRHEPAGRGARRRQDGRGAAVRHAAGRAAAPATWSSPPAGAERGELLRERYGVEVVGNAEAAKARRHADPRRSSRRTWACCSTSSPPHVPADRLVVSVAAGITTAFIERRLADGHPGRAGHVQHPGAGRRGDERDLGRGARRREEHLRRTEELLRAGRQDDPGARVAAGRRHRAVRQRPGVLLLPGRGDDRRRASCSGCRATSRTT